MLHSKSITTRFLISVVSNGIRAILSLFTGVVIARSLGPSGYGDLVFLLGSFVALRTLLDMGSASAFYTFMSQRSRGRDFYFLYFSWLALQFALTVMLVALLIPSAVFDRVWLGHGRETVLLAFLATFMQQQIWQTVGQIGEATRKSVKVQLLNLVVAVTYLALISVLSFYQRISVVAVLLLLIGQYALATLGAIQFLRENRAPYGEEEVPRKQLIRQYFAYCKPLVALSLIGFLYDFADKWMLQRFGGPAEQGFFQIASQFSAVSLLATSSILSIFWKEIADAWAKHDLGKVAKLYHKVNRGLVMLGAIATGLLLPWSEQIVSIVLGPAYLQGWPVLALMLLYPIHQSMGQIGGTMLLASAQTRRFMIVGSSFMLASIPLSYLMLAPSSGVLIPGFGLGALGMASKMVLLGMASVNVQAWVVARHGGWKFDWTFQLVGIPLMLGLGYFSKMLVGLVWSPDTVGIGQLVAPALTYGLVYVCLVMTALWFLPWLMGMERSEILRLLKRGG